MKFLLNRVVQFIRPFWRTLLLIIIVSFSTLLLSAAVFIWLSHFHNLHFPSFGTIRAISVEAYGGNIGTMQNGTKFIDWGTVYPGSVIKRSFYVKSKSNSDIILNFTRGDVVFRDSKDQVVAKPVLDEEPLRIVSDYTDTPLKPGEEIFVTLSLHVSSDEAFVNYLVGNGVQYFSFDIYISPKK